MNWLLWVGLIVATWRVTRLLVKDEFPPIKVIRNWFIDTFWDAAFEDERPQRPAGVTRWSWFWRRFGHSIAYLWTCMWCMSFWVGLALWWSAVWLGFSVPLPWLLLAAASGVSGLIGNIENRIDQSWEEAEKRLGR